MDNYIVDYNNQYNKLYKTRLATIRQYIKVDMDTPICKSILEINKHKEECVIIGTLFMASDLKQTIFDKINPNDKKLKISSNTYCSEEVKYYAEDETGKIELKFEQEEDLITTGMVLGYKGSYVDTIFRVNKVIYPEPLKPTNREPSTPKIAFVSNICVDNENNSVLLRIMFDYLKLNNIKTVVVLGNFFDRSFAIFQKLINSLDLDLILIPEYKDFACKTFPISTVHPKLFEIPTKTYENPSIFSISGLNFGVTSSFIVKDLLKYIPQGLKDVQTEPGSYRMHVEAENKLNVETENKFENVDNILKALISLIRARHLCPNAPDTVPTVPYSGRDPFFIEKPIDFLFVKDDEFKTKKCQTTGVTVFTIPDFSTSNEILIMDGDTIKPLKLDKKSLN
ncbi:DNA polymerase delta small subunit [Nosema granulosis]|uniref:DNA polymerase delta small subunit n=1 Tax=Nosema granulosis TaxID=83296 RepID=A0A9P6GXT2_9MICR|nr:DNA polymerase delta small subunit [Nosema granulosis]